MLNIYGSLIYFFRVVETFTPAQNSTGGFGGGHGQISHCAPSYAVILSLAQVDAHRALEMVDRRALSVVTTRIPYVISHTDAHQMAMARST